MIDDKLDELAFEIARQIGFRVAYATAYAAAMQAVYSGDAEVGCGSSWAQKEASKAVVAMGDFFAPHPKKATGCD